MNASNTSTETLAQQLACLAAHWVAQQIAPHIPLECARDVTHAWCVKKPLELALLPDAQRVLAAATQELLVLLAQFPEGRQALRDFGFGRPFLEDIDYS
jgi:hypothetical protein